MTGLDRIIARILSDAKAKAGDILDTAKEECRIAARDYAAQADAIHEQSAAAAEAESEQIIGRARSAAAMERRRILSEARIDLIDEAFTRAILELRADKENYKELLAALLNSALIEAIQSEKQGLARGDEVTPITGFTVLMNAEDGALYGDTVLEKARRTVRGRTGRDLTGCLTLSEETPRIPGGLLLRYGKIEADCTLVSLLQSVRRELEPKVAALLFDDEQRMY